MSALDIMRSILNAESAETVKSLIPALCHAGGTAEQIEEALDFLEASIINENTTEDEMVRISYLESYCDSRVIRTVRRMWNLQNQAA